MVKKSLLDNEEMLIISAAIEADINEFDDPSDKQDFLSEIGLKEPGVNKIIKSVPLYIQCDIFIMLGLCLLYV